MVDETEIVAKKPANGWEPYKTYVLGILLVIFTFNFIDRQIIAILSPAIKEDLGLNDTQLGFLKGFAFAIFYASFGIPLARLADRHNRVTIISVSLAFWSAMTALCGLAANFTQLAIARIGVGVGEAGCTPPAHAILSDYFSREQRATALGIYSLGIPIGTVFGFLAGGWMVGTLGWRWAFILVGLPGIFLAILAKLTVKEIKRGSADLDVGSENISNESSTSTQSFSTWLNLKVLWKIKSFRILSIGAALSSFSGYALSMWIVDFLVRTFDLSIGEVTVPLAITLGIGGGLGTACGGFVSDHFAAKDERSIFTLPAVAHALGVPLLAIVIWTQSALFAFVLLFPFYVLTTSVTGPYFSLVQNLAPFHMRAFASAIFLFILNAIGFGLGPLFVGMMSDVLEPSLGDTLSLQWALTAILPVYLASSAVMLFGRLSIKKDLGVADKG